MRVSLLKFEPRSQIFRQQNQVSQFLLLMLREKSELEFMLYFFRLLVYIYDLDVDINFNQDFSFYMLSLKERKNHTKVRNKNILCSEKTFITYKKQEAKFFL